MRRSPRGRVTRAVVLVLLAAGLIVATDALAARVNGAGRVIDPPDIPVAQRWGDQISTGDKLTLSSREVTLSVHGDSLDICETVTGPASGTLARLVSSVDDGGAADDFASDVLDTVQVAEFRYGFTGPGRFQNSVQFGEPLLRIKDGTATVTAEAIPVRLYLARQYVTLTAPADTAVAHGALDRVTVNSPSGQVRDPAGVTAVNDQGNSATLMRTKPVATFSVMEDNSSGSWLSSLRSVGGISIPVAGTLLFRLGNLFNYFVLLWALTSARRKRPDLWPVVVAHRAVLVLATAFVAVAVLGSGEDLGSALFPGNQGWISAGPLALLVAGAALVWPVACCRGALADRPGIGWPLLTSMRARAAAAAYLLIPCVYLISLHLNHHIDPPDSVQVIVGTAVVTAFVPPLVHQLLGRRGLTAWLLSAIMLMVIDATTYYWPWLFSETFTLDYSSVPNVNVAGKWTFTMIAAIVIVGLCVLAGRTARALAVPNARRQWLVSTGFIAAAGIAVMVDVVRVSRLGNAHAIGMAPLDLWDLFDALPQLTDWLILALAITVVMRVPRAPETRGIIRLIGLPIALILLYWNFTWLYLPVTLIVGLIVVSRLVLPRGLAEAAPNSVPPGDALRASLDGWRAAEFADDRRKALTGDTASARRRYLTFAREHDARQCDARAAVSEAFSWKGMLPDRRAALTGAVAGGIAGIIPATITVLTTSPPADSTPYAVLDFFGVTAWNLLVWGALGWFVGYYLPLLRGDGGTGKALWLTVATIVPNLPISVVWNDQQDWTGDAIGFLQWFVFLVIVTVAVCDFRVLTAARMRLSDWVRVHNRRFVVTWSTTLIAALVTAATAFLTTAATDLANHAFSNTPPSVSGSRG